MKINCASWLRNKDSTCCQGTKALSLIWLQLVLITLQGSTNFSTCSTRRNRSKSVMMTLLYWYRMVFQTRHFKRTNAPPLFFNYNFLNYSSNPLCFYWYSSDSCPRLCLRNTAMYHVFFFILKITLISLTCSWQVFILIMLKKICNHWYVCHLNLMSDSSVVCSCSCYLFSEETER